MDQTWLTAIGAILTAIATVMGAFALVLSRRTEHKSATKEETQQAFDLQQVAMKNVLEDNIRLRARQDDLHKSMNSVLGKLGEMTAKHETCDRNLKATNDRLKIAEARILELGG